MKKKCKCGKIATWYYMPGDNDWACCDDCVPRGCICWQNPIQYEDGSIHNPQGIKGEDWEWVEENKYWEELDGNGRKLPCIEWWYNKEGWDDED